MTYFVGLKIIVKCYKTFSYHVSKTFQLKMLIEHRQYVKTYIVSKYLNIFFFRYLENHISCLFS